MRELDYILVLVGVEGWKPHRIHAAVEWEASPGSLHWLGLVMEPF